MNRTSLPSNLSRALLLSLALSGVPALAQTASPSASPAISSTTRTADSAQTAALTEAVKRKQWEAAQAAVLAGADANAVDKKGVTVLMRASEAHQTELVDLLLKNGAKADAVDGIGRTALHYAIPAGNQPKKKKFGFGSVMNAVSGGLGGMMGGSNMLGGFGSLLGGGGLDSLLGSNLTSLLSGGAFDLGGKGGWSAIAGAALQGDSGGKLGIASLLAGKGAGKLDASGWTNMLSSVKSTKPEILGAMSKLSAGAGGEVQNNPMWDQFLNAAASGDQKSVAELMKKPELQSILAQAQSGLAGAANDLPGNASRQIIESLVKNGANASAATRDGDTAAKIAQERGLTEIAALLGGQ